MSSSVNSDFEAVSGEGLVEQAANASLDVANSAKQSVFGKRQ